jgi:hypothetical protein
MPVLNATNPWGKIGGIEPQRSDLWTLDLEQALKSLRGSFGEQFSLPDANTTKFYARSVTYPETKIAPYESKKHSVPLQYPGMDEPLGEIRVDFIIDAGQVDSSGTFIAQANSRILNLIRLWHEAARVGRPTRSPVESSVQAWLGTQPLPISNLFKFDVIVRYFTGLITDNSLNTTDSDSGFGQDSLTPTTVVKLMRCWVASYQLNQLDHESQGLSKLTVAFIAEAIVPDQDDDLTP